MKIIQTKSGIAKKRETYERMGLTYDLAITGSSVTLTSQFGVSYIASENKLSNQDLTFINRVIDHIEDRIDKSLVILNPVKEKTRMFRIGHTRQVYKSGVVEIDINGAYWRAAYLLGFIDISIYNLAYTDRELRLTQEGAKMLGVKYDDKKYYKIYQSGTEGFHVYINGGVMFVAKNFCIPKYRPSKEVRLMALGTLAKKTEHLHYNGKELVRVGIQKTDQKLITAWEMICNKVHSLMNEISHSIPEQDFILYWVDALVVKESSKKQVIEHIEKAKFQYKEKKIKGIEINKKEIRVKDTDNWQEDRVFNIG